MQSLIDDVTSMQLSGLAEATIPRYFLDKNVVYRTVTCPWKHANMTAERAAHLVKGQTQLVLNNLSSCQNCNVFQVAALTLPKSRSLHGNDLQDSCTLAPAHIQGNADKIMEISDKLQHQQQQHLEVASEFVDN